MTCSETYYPQWSSRGMRGVRCQHPAKWQVVGQSNPSKNRALCGVHARSFRTWNPLVRLELLA